MVGYLERTARRAWLPALVALVATLALAVATARAPAQEGGVGGPPRADAPGAGGDRQVYPIRGGHEYWRGIGGGHDGVDIGARCGTPLVASVAGRVGWVKYHGAAGHYVVIDAAEGGIDLVYMHLSRRAGVRTGQSIAAGQLIGFVGDSGNASGCHLHFEVWEGAYYGGGSPIDPMPFLASWERDRKKRTRRGR